MDCEYNRIGDIAKRLNRNLYEKYKRILGYKIDNLLKEKNNDKLVKPDIIIHKRGKNEQNLLVIEVKKSNSKDDNYDRLKLMIFTDKDYGLNYKYGLFIKLDKEREHNKLCWFSDGKCIRV